MATRLTNRIPVKDSADLAFGSYDDMPDELANVMVLIGEALIGTEAGENLASTLRCYFSLPNNERLQYPCLILEFQNFDQREADNRKYISHAYLTMTFISNNGRLAYASKNVLSIPYCSFDRYFKTDHLHHMVYRLYIKDDLNG